MSWQKAYEAFDSIANIIREDVQAEIRDGSLVLSRWGLSNAIDRFAQTVLTLLALNIGSPVTIVYRTKEKRPRVIWNILDAAPAVKLNSLLEATVSRLSPPNELNEFHSCGWVNKQYSSILPINDASDSPNIDLTFLALKSHYAGIVTGKAMREEICVVAIRDWWLLAAFWNSAELNFTDWRS